MEILNGMKVNIEIPKAAVMQYKRNAALDMAIEALKCSEIPNCSDAISRQAAIDAVSRGCQEFRGIFAECEKNLNELPPAQPTYTNAEIQKMQDIEQAQLEKAFALGREDAKAEIIRCKDCEHWDVTWEGSYGPNYHYCPIIDGTFSGNFYCADAERKNDGENISE